MISTKSGKKLYNYEEVAQMVGLSKRTIQAYAKALGLALYTELGKVYIDEAQIVQLAKRSLKSKS